MNIRLRMPQLTGEAAFKELTAYLPHAELESVMRGLDKLPSDLMTDEALAKMILNGEWQTLFSKTNAERQHFPFQALRCLRKGLITSMVFCTSQMFYNIYLHPKNDEAAIRSFAIFNSENKKLKPAARHMINETMKLYSVTHKTFDAQKHAKSTIAALLTLLRDYTPTDITPEWAAPSKPVLLDWDEKSERMFYHLLKQLPACEQQFLVIPDPHFDPVTKQYNTDSSLMKEINYRVRYNTFGRFMENDLAFVMIPTRGMMQAYIEALRKDDAHIPRYRFCFSSVAELHHSAREGHRDMYQCFAPLAHLTPPRIDSYTPDMQECGPEKHDFYHQNRSSCIPKPEAKLFSEITELHLLVGKVEKQFLPYVEDFVGDLADREFGKYDPNKYKKDAKEAKTFAPLFKKFWTTLEITAKRSLVSYHPLPNTGSDTAPQDMFIHYFAEYFIANEARWMKEYGMSIDNLLNYSGDTNGFVTMLRNQVSHLLRKRTNRSITDLTIAFQNEQELGGPALRMTLTTSVCKQLIENFCKTVVTTIESESKPMIDIVIQAVKEKIRTYFADGSLTELQNKHPDTFRKMMDIIVDSQQGEELLMSAASNHGTTPGLFNLLYDSRFVNRASMPGNTLAYQAIAAKDLELFLRLTNDGASVAKVANSNKPSPAEKAKSIKNDALLAAVKLAEKGGKGWVERSPTLVARLRRLHASITEPKGKHDEELLKADRKWLSDHLGDDNKSSYDLHSIFSRVGSGDVSKNVISFSFGM